jgi:hypothetical protein
MVPSAHQTIAKIEDLTARTEPSKNIMFTIP